MLEVEARIAHLPLMIIRIVISEAWMFALGQVRAQAHAQRDHGALDTFHAALLSHVAVYVRYMMQVRLAESLAHRCYRLVTHFII
jgi:hypothetical protein